MQQIMNAQTPSELLKFKFCSNYLKAKNLFHNLFMSLKHKIYFKRVTHCFIGDGIEGVQSTNY